MLIDNFTYCISQLDKCIRAATCKVCVQPDSFVSADSCCGSFGEVKTLFCLETKAYLDEGVFVALQTFRLNLGRKRQKITTSFPPPPPFQIKDVKKARFRLRPVCPPRSYSEALTTELLEVLWRAGRNLILLVRCRLQGGVKTRIDLRLGKLTGWTYNIPRAPFGQGLIFPPPPAVADHSTPPEISLGHFMPSEKNKKTENYISGFQTPNEK